MKRFRNLVIGGIQSKVFNLILLTVLLLSAACLAVSIDHANMLEELAAESGARQQAAIQKTTDAVMGTVVGQALSRSTELKAYIADELFRGLETRVRMMGDYAERLFSDPQAYPGRPYAAPDAGQNGQVVTQLMLAEGVDAGIPALSDRIALSANMDDLMAALFEASAVTNSCFIALPEGAFLVTDDRSAAKLNTSGEPLSYDPRTRPWYRQAVESGGLIFTDVEVDAFTGDAGVVCAMPVYVRGELAAVVGSDLFLTTMQAAVQSSDENGGYLCVINQNGHVVFSPRTEGVFQVLPASSAADLRQSDNAGLAALATDAMQGKTDMRLITLEGEEYYAVGAPMHTLGWALISVCRRDVAHLPTQMLMTGFGQIQQETSASYQEKTARTKAAAIALLIAVSLLMLFCALALSKRIVRPLNTITKRISEMTGGEMEFTMEDAYRTGDEVEELAQSFAAVSHRAAEYLDAVRRVTAEKERIGTELSLATKIQAAMLPHTFPAFPDRPDFDIYASMDPAREVGGDFYDYFLIDDDHLCMVIADVSGKGVPAALFMMASRIILQSAAMLGLSPAAILTKANETICSGNEAQMFVTVWLGILELSTGRLTCANAGHEYPVLKRPGGEYALYKDRHGFVVGGMEGTRYREYELGLEPGSRLFVYTDGLTEATNADDELFGAGRMIAALNERPDAAPQEVLRNMRAAVDGFVQEAEQFDDLTMLCMEYKGRGA